MARIIGSTSATAAISRQECMLSMGLPTSSVRMPMAAAEMGPMVLPQGMSLRDTKRCGEKPASRQAASKAPVPGENRPLGRIHWSIPRPWVRATTMSSSPKAGAMWTMPVPDLVVTWWPWTMRKASPPSGAPKS